MQCPKHKQLLQTMTVSDPSKHCEMCGSGASLKCSSCNFFLCRWCRICDKRHFLVKMLNLEVVVGLSRKSRPSTTPTITCAVRARRIKSETMMACGTVTSATMMCVRSVSIESTWMAVLNWFNSCPLDYVDSFGQSIDHRESRSTLPSVFDDGDK